MTDIVISPERAGEETATRDRAFRVNSLGPAIPATGHRHAHAVDPPGTPPA